MKLVRKVNAAQTADSNLVLKTSYNTKANKIGKKVTDHDYVKYISTQEFNKLTSENIASRLAQTNLAIKNDIANFVKKADFDDKPKELLQIKEKVYLLKMN